MGGLATLVGPAGLKPADKTPADLSVLPLMAKVPEFTEICFGLLPLSGTRRGTILAADVGPEQVRMRGPANERTTILGPAMDLDIQPMIGKRTSVTGVQFLKPERTTA